jgi:hypothetical protein
MDQPRSDVTGGINMRVLIGCMVVLWICVALLLGLLSVLQELLARDPYGSPRDSLRDLSARDSGARR